METKTIIIILVTLGAILFIGASKVIMPIGMGICIFLTFMLLYGCLPIWLRKILAHIHLIVDIAMTYLSYHLISSHTATGLFASAIVGLCVTLYLMSERKRLLGKEEGLDAIMKRAVVYDPKIRDKLNGHR